MLRRDKHVLNSDRALALTIWDGQAVCESPAISIPHAYPQVKPPPFDISSVLYVDKLAGRVARCFPSIFASLSGVLLACQSVFKNLSKMCPSYRSGQTQQNRTLWVLMSAWTLWSDSVVPVTSRATGLAVRCDVR